MTRYGRLTVIGTASPGANYNKRVVCICDCGAEKIVFQNNLNRGLSRSCGCLRDELAPKHNVVHEHARKGRRTAEYATWVGMISRCYDSRSTSFHRYGGRGITVCDRWRFGTDEATAYECFLADMGARPSPHHSIEREANDGHYEPDNCRWATCTEQSRNTRRNRIVEIHGRKMPLAEAIERFGRANPRTIASRLSYGYSPDVAVLTPAFALTREQMAAKAGGRR